MCFQSEVCQVLYERAPVRSLVPLVVAQILHDLTQFCIIVHTHVPLAGLASIVVGVRVLERERCSDSRARMQLEQVGFVGMTEQARMTIG